MTKFLREIQKFFTRNNLVGTKTAVVGHQKELVQTYIASRYPDVNFAVQLKQLGTADDAQHAWLGPAPAGSATGGVARHQGLVAAVRSTANP